MPEQRDRSSRSWPPGRGQGQGSRDASSPGRQGFRRPSPSDIAEAAAAETIELGCADASRAAARARRSRLRAATRARSASRCRASFGWHILRVTEIEPARPSPSTRCGTSSPTRWRGTWPRTRSARDRQQDRGCARRRRDARPRSRSASASSCDQGRSGDRCQGPRRGRQAGRRCRSARGDPARRLRHRSRARSTPDERDRRTAAISSLQVDSVQPAAVKPLDRGARAKVAAVAGRAAQSAAAEKPRQMRTAAKAAARRSPRSPRAQQARGRATSRSRRSRRRPRRCCRLAGRQDVRHQARRTRGLAPGRDGWSSSQLKDVQPARSGRRRRRGHAGQRSARAGSMPRRPARPVRRRRCAPAFRSPSDSRPSIALL